MFSVKRIRTSLGDACTVLPTLGSARWRNACASSRADSTRRIRKKPMTIRLIYFLRRAAGPDYAGIYGAGGLSLRAAIQRTFERKLHQRNHPIKWRMQMQVLHLRLEVDQAVLQCEPPLQHVGMALNVDRTCAGQLVYRDSACAGAGGNCDAHQPCESDRLQEAQLSRQIAEAFAEENPGRPGTE